MTLNLRLTQEFTDLQREPLDFCYFRHAEDGNTLHWTGHMSGPADSSNKQVSLPIFITFPEEYPWKPFNLFFTTPISHPNVSANGEVHLPEFEDEHWSPVQTVRSIMVSLQVALGNPEPSEKNCTPKDEAESQETHVKPTHHGRKIGEKKYGMDKSRLEYQYWLDMVGGQEEKDKFFMENADVVRDA